MLIHKGSRVTSGQKLITLWNEDLRGQLELTRKETLASIASADQACQLAGNAEAEARRIQRLHQEKQVSEQQAETAQAQALASTANCQAARARVAVNRARESVAAAAVERTILRAPFPGIVAEVNGEVGEFITPSPTGVATLPAIDLIDNQCLFVSAPIDEVDAPKIKPGLFSKIHLDAFPDRQLTGSVSRVAPYVQEREKQARTVEIEIRFNEPSDLDAIRPGFSADCEVVIESQNNVLRIPTDAIMEGGRVLVFNPTTQLLSSRRISPGLSNWQMTEIRAGLHAGEHVVTSVGRDGVQDGALAQAAAPEQRP